MVIANGFITKTVEEAYEEVRNRCTTRVLPVPFPTVDTMTYWLSETGEIFGTQRMASMCITKPLKIERKYKRGCHMRYSVYGGGRQKEAFMQNIMYSTFVAKEFLPDLQFEFRDGNQYNYQLDNIVPVKPKVNQKLLDNMDIYKSVYKTEFNKVLSYVRWKHNNIPVDDLKDIVSEAFFYLCGFRLYDAEDNFAAIWTRVSDYRCIDYYNRYLYTREGLFTEDGSEERFPSPSCTPVETADIWKHIRGEKTRKIMHLYYNENLTPTEIAKEIGSTLSNVSSCITHTTQSLRKIYSNDIHQYNYDTRQT